MTVGTDPLVIGDAVKGATAVVEHLLDAALARVIGAPVGDMPEELPVIVKQLSASPKEPSREEVIAASRSVGVNDRTVEALAAAPALPLSLVRSRDGSGRSRARASALEAGPIWRLAGLATASSDRAALRAERLDDWVRANFLLLEGRIDCEPHDQRTIWTLLHGEARWRDGFDDLAGMARDFAKEAPEPPFIGAFLCLEHALRLGVSPDAIDAEDPLLSLPLAAAPRYALTVAEPPLAFTPTDFHHHLFSTRRKTAA